MGGDAARWRYFDCLHDLADFKISQSETRDLSIQPKSNRNLKLKTGRRLRRVNVHGNWEVFKFLWFLLINHKYIRLGTNERGTTMFFQVSFKTKRFTRIHLMLCFIESLIKT